MAYYILKSYKLKFNPLWLFEVFSRQKNCFFLDSSLNTHSLGRYSFLGFEPFQIISLKNETTDPFAKIRDSFNAYRMDFKQNKLPFLGGLVGFLSYDLGFALEKKVTPRAKEETQIPDCFFAFYNSIVIIDHQKKVLHICAIGFPEKDQHLAKALAETNLKNIENLISCACFLGDNKQNNYPVNDNMQLSSNFNKEDYILAVKKAKDYIKKGDIYQVNLSQQFKAKTDILATELYKRLRKISPSNFSAYFDCGKFQIISSSPERFLTLAGDKVITRPMKGTRKRADNKKEDNDLKQQLLKSAKDKAELTMIVDLERNDLGKVCDYKTIKVKRLRELEKYATVYQTTSTIEGKLYKNKDMFDLLRACFPGGSITGCPKIRAMEIIEELEPSRRSIYTGGLGYLGFNGNMDFSILIRTILKNNNQLSFGVGGGIVADSDPESEYQETLVKAKAMIGAISQ